MITKRKLEFWADSFHEGDWACRGLANQLDLVGVEYLNGFIPQYLYALTPDLQLEVTVFGSYRNWNPLPEAIDKLLAWGKPDLVVYDPEAETIILALEETSAVPTGNQALQRCERIYGAARLGIPFWYLLPEFGRHLDGGVRTDSIWPTVLALKLSCMRQTPSIVLHYADSANPEDYNFGTGLQQLFLALSTQIRIWAGLSPESDLEPILAAQYQDMLDFIERQWANMLTHLPGTQEMSNSALAEAIAAYVSRRTPSLNFREFLVWGKTATLAAGVHQAITPGGSIKPDIFVSELEKIIVAKRGYNLSSHAGSRPQPAADVSTWIELQRREFEAHNTTSAQFELKPADFPASPTGLHLTTAKNILYLCDAWSDVHQALTQAFPRLKTAALPFEATDPVLLYISNSLRPGRIFGDPFAGQLAAYGTIFSRDLHGQKNRLVLAYYPHQSHTQLFDTQGRLRVKKGTTVMQEIVDIAIFIGGVVVRFDTMEVL